jgi:hypothetical protein
MTRPEFCFKFEGTTICFVKMYHDCWICSLPGFVGDALYLKLSKAEDISIEQLGLPSRPYNALKAEGLLTVHDVLQKNEKELLNMPNFGRTSIRDLKFALKSIGFELEV